jgi:hypothetical protein
VPLKQFTSVRESKNTIAMPEYDYHWILDVNWEKARVVVDLTREMIRSSPPYQPTMAWSANYAAALHEHYGRPSDQQRQHLR